MTRTIIVEDAEHLLVGDKSAAMAAVTNTDRYRYEQGWNPVTDLVHGAHVLTVSHFGTQTSEVGEVVAVRSEKTGEIVGQYQITYIRMVDTAQLGDVEVKALGYKTHEELITRVSDRRMWYMELMPVAGLTH
jgi:hypothetical protein